MILTDPKLSPSKRLFEILNFNFSTEGFILKGSAFTRSFENRIQKIHLRFLTWGKLVSAEVSWSVTFIEIEKVLNAIQFPKKRTFDPTIWNDLLNYSICKQNNARNEFELNDSKDNSYNDVSLNLAAEEIIKSYKEFIVPYFLTYNSLESLAAEINKTPIRYCELIKNIEKRIFCGLVLSRKLYPINFEGIYQEYSSYLRNLNFTEKEKYLVNLKSFFEVLETKSFNW
jgi:hypothetical protein